MTKEKAESVADCFNDAIRYHFGIVLFLGEYKKLLENPQKFLELEGSNYFLNELKEYSEDDINSILNKLFSVDFSYTFNFDKKEAIKKLTA